MRAYRTPGVYFEWPDAPPPAIVPLRTDVAGFVGIAARGPLHQAVRIESWTQFASTFGAHIPAGTLAYAVEGFFANGGRTCWVVRVADPAAARPASATIVTGGMHLRCVASSPGTWGNNLVATWRAEPFAPARDRRLELSVRLGDGPREVWPNLKLEPHALAAVLHDSITGSRQIQVALLAQPSEALKESTPNRPVTFVGGTDGLASLTPAHLSGEGAPAGALWGLAALAGIDEISVVAIPDAVPPEAVAATTTVPRRLCQILEVEPLPPPRPPAAPEFAPAAVAAHAAEVQVALIRHCTRLADRVALIDPPRGPLTAQDALAWRDNFDSGYAATYVPWLQVPDPLRLNGLLRLIPPCGHVAGAYARSDRRIGVHKPPANERLEAATDVAVAFDDAAHGALNEAGINVIRAYGGRGIRVAGARTLSSDPLWRYVNVRRLLIMIEEAIDAAMQPTVFEPNNPDLWRETDRAARAFLDELWRRGMLDGASAEEAYFVQCDESTNPPAETEAGRMTCRIGVQPPWPAEFVVVRIGRTDTGMQSLVETGAADG